MKKYNEHTIDRISRDLLKNYSEAPPQGAFFAIQDGLHASSGKNRKQYLLYIAATWLVLLSFGLGYLTRSYNASETENQATNSSKKHFDSKLNNLVAQNNSAVFVNKNKHLRNSISNSFLTQKSSNIIIVNETNSTVTVSTIDNISNTISESKNVNTDTNKVLSHIDSLKLMYKFIALSSGNSMKDTADKSNVVLAYNEPLLPLETSTKSHWSVSGGVASMMAVDMFGIAQDQNTNSRSLKEGIVLPSPSVNKTVSLSYSTGLSVKRTLSDNWNIRSGLNYNKISESNVDISYVEVPVLSEFRILNKGLKIYFTNGVGAGFKQTDLYPLGLTGFSLLYPISKMVDFNIEPSYKHVFGKSWTYKADYYGMMAGFNVKF